MLNPPQLKFRDILQKFNLQRFYGEALEIYRFSNGLTNTEVLQLKAFFRFQQGPLPFFLTFFRALGHVVYVHLMDLLFITRVKPHRHPFNNTCSPVE